MHTIIKFKNPCLLVIANEIRKGLFKIQMFEIKMQILFKNMIENQND